MKIDQGATPIFVSPRRHDGGATVIQGTSRLRLRPAEMRELVHALQEMMPSGQRADQIEESGH